MVRFSWLLFTIAFKNLIIAQTNHHPSNEVSLIENFNASAYPKIYSKGIENKLTVFSNNTSNPEMEDSLIFDFLFQKKGKFDVNNKIKVEFFNDAGEQVYVRIDSVGLYKFIHLTNFPEEKNPYAVRINLNNLKNKFELLTVDDKIFLTLKISIVKNNEKPEKVLFERNRILLMIKPD
jgi:hypothetical protein